MSALAPDHWYVVHEVRSEEWPYVRLTARLGPYASETAASLHCLKSVGEKVRFWDGENWKVKS